MSDLMPRDTVEKFMSDTRYDCFNLTSCSMCLFTQPIYVVIGVYERGQ